MNTRNFRVKGIISCLYASKEIITTMHVSGIEVQLWSKVPLESIFLGSSVTDDNGVFVVDFQMDSPVSLIAEGKIEDVFIQAFLKGKFISGDNLLSGLTINEGYTDLGDFTVHISLMEVQSGKNVTRPVLNSIPFSNTVLFKLGYESGQTVPSDLKAVFSIYNADGTVANETTLNPTAEGFIQLITPVLPVVVTDSDTDTIIHYQVKGPLDARSEECYLTLSDEKGNMLYTLISDIVIHDGLLKIFDNREAYYTIDPAIEVSAKVSAIDINERGEIYGYDLPGNEWQRLGTLLFTMIEFPQSLISVADGFYQGTRTSGTLTTGALGAPETLFWEYTGVVANPETYFLKVGLAVFNPEGDDSPAIFSGDFIVMPGDTNYIPVLLAGAPPVATHESPGIAEIQKLSGVTFSPAFSDFLSSKKLTTVDAVRKAGPITYMKDYPSKEVGSEEVSTLQAHVDLYSVNNDITQNQLLIDAGYGKISSIANKPKNLFLDDVVDGGLPLFRAAQIHEVAVQNVKWVSNMLAGTLSDIQLRYPTQPGIDESNWIKTSLGNAVSTCGCDDCKSGISPFAYLMDLIKYASIHLDYNDTAPNNTYAHGDNNDHNINTNKFINLISKQFLQPFGTLNVDCKTLHDEYCRVRLVTEVLEKLVDKSVIPLIQSQTLIIERNQYLMLVYKTLLTYAGTSLTELRDVVTSHPADVKLVAAQKLSDKLGIPLYAPGTTISTTETLWLTIGNTDPHHALTAVNLETIFGFRDTKRDVITDTPVSLMEQWRAAYLRGTWKQQDYFFSDFSREDVDPNNVATFKSNWKPIIDPDNMGWEDMTYLTSVYAKAIWERRKEDTDAFLKFCLTDNLATSITSADQANRTLKVLDRDIVSHTLDGNKVQIKDPVTHNWIDFTVFSRKVVGTDTDVTLTTPAPAMFQPYQTPALPPAMHYKRELNVPVSAISGTTTVVIDWSTSVMADHFAGGYVKLKSTGGTQTTYETAPIGVGSLLISSVLFNSDQKVTLTLSSGLPGTFTASGSAITFVYEVEVPVYYTRILNPELICEEFCTNKQTYNLLGSPGTVGTLANTNLTPYWVWNLPSGWTQQNVYANLKLIYQSLNVGSATQADKDLISSSFHMSLPAFSRMMVLMAACEKYLLAMFTYARPTDNDLYELASILRSCGKEQMRTLWVQEEIKHADPLNNPIKLQLSGAYFWKSLAEPIEGSWDPGLQTIPSTAWDINPYHQPIIDPEILSLQNMLVNPEAKPYHDLYAARQASLDGKFTTYRGLVIPFSSTGFDDILNDVATGPNTSSFLPFIYPYNTLGDLSTDLQGNDVFKQKQAADVLWSAFRLSGEDFLTIYNIKLAYESPNPLQMPVSTEIEKAVRILVSAFKRSRLYPSRRHGFIVLFIGWIEEEITGSYTSPVIPVHYYNVLKMQMAPGRSDSTYRKDWQATLYAWNRQAIIQPDIVPPENIENFVSTNPNYLTWNTRRSDLIHTYNLIAGYLNSNVGNAGTLFNNFKGQIDLVIARAHATVPFPTQDYLHYFTEIKDRETNGEDIRPYLEQFGISIIEYRFLSNIYRVLEGSLSNAFIPLIDTEFDDIINILLAIRVRNLSFDWVQEEYAAGIILEQDYFQLYKPAISNFPISDLTAYNQWRSSYGVRKNWENTLQSRIDREAALEDDWKNTLKETEDRNMPLLRDALIRALTGPCQSWHDVAEGIAKSYFIETEDSCCFKHTRVSFAIETLQGLVFALQNGVYGDSLTNRLYASFIDNYKLIAPNIKQEWEWIGSYATWRAAMFVFLYPENLLYPTLKRSQSPAFISLNNTIQSANRFSPEDACKAAKDFEKYIKDIEDLEIIFSTSIRGLQNQESPNDCCNCNATILKEETYFFAQTKEGIPYWCIKQTQEWDGLGFWEALPIDTQNIKLLGCFVFGDRWQGWKDYPPAAILFYSYNDKGKLKMAYIKKPLFIADSEWLASKDCEDLPIVNSSSPSFITACQQSEDWEPPTFVFSFNEDNALYVYQTMETRAHRAYNYNLFEDKFEYTQCEIYNSQDSPALAIRHLFPSPWLAILTLVFPLNPSSKWDIQGSAYVFVIGYQRFLKWSPVTGPLINTKPLFKEIVGGFESRYEDNLASPPGPIFSLIIHYRDDKDIYRVIKLKLDGAVLYDYVRYIVQFPVIIAPSEIIINKPTILTKIYPVYQERDAQRVFAVKDTNSRIFSIKFLDASSTANYCILKPEKISEIDIDSAECIADINLHKIGIENIMKLNMNQPQGSSVSWIMRPAIIRDLLYEAYYFVPMLLALDQQRRGQYTSALSWYRSIYDYTNSGASNRKIFYGLVLEGLIQNSFVQACGWLLDPLNPHFIAQTRINAYTKYTLMNIIQCLYAYADREFTMDTIETIPIARKLYTTALNLLKVTELDIKSNLCTSTATHCLTTQTTDVFTDRVWVNQASRLQQSLEEIGDPEIIDSLAEDIAGQLNSATEETMAANFAAAFDMIKAASRVLPPVETITESIAGSEERLNEAYSYHSALNDPDKFNKSVSDMYSVAVAGISGLKPEEVASEESAGRLAWLQESMPDNTAPYQFRFATYEGRQFLSGDLVYNPLNPTRRAYQANIFYYNAPSVIGAYQVGMPVSYTPLFGYPFCTPQNPVYQSLLLKGNLELYKIFNCRNIAGMVRELDAFAAATDSTTGIPTIGASGNLVLPGLNNFTPSQYRFRVLIERAKQIAAQAQQMESLFLAAIEKKDMENYNQLRAQQDLETAKATVKLQDIRITQASDEKTVADLQLNKVVFTRDHFDNLLAAGYLSFEQDSLKYLASAEIFQYAAATLSGLSSMFDEPGNSFSSLAGASGSIAAALSTQSAFLSQIASYERRAQEWQFQKDLAGQDIGIANQQIKVADDNVRIVTQEREVAQLNTDHAQASLDFLKTKFTNAELYNWMGNVLERSYSYMLNLSTAVARTAEGQLYFERQEQAGPFILNDYWGASSTNSTLGSSGSQVDRRGLTGSARLLVDITRLDQYAFDTNKRKLQMTKVISLAQNFPSEFQQFRETGEFNFSLTNQFFDYDFPGHYLRLINGIKTTVVGLLPVYDQIKASLTADTISYTVIGGNIFQKTPIRRLELDSVALTSANNATGLFELQPSQSDFLNPFEGMGIESRWEFKMPQFSNRFDYDNIADVLLTVEYTALDDYQYRYQVLQNLENTLSFNRGFSLKNNFPDQWYELGEAVPGPPEFSVTFELKREMFPQGINNLRLNGSDILLYFVREDNFIDEIQDVDIRLASNISNNPPSSSTANGILPTSALINTSTSPLLSLRLLFDNNPINRDLFSKGQVKDILLLVGCKADLKPYPL